MKCPKCGDHEVRRSRHGKWADLLHLPLGQKAFRCRKCRRRFYAVVIAESADAPGAQPHSKNGGESHRRSHGNEKRRGLRRIRPWMWEAAIFTLMLLLFLIFLR